MKVLEQIIAELYKAVVPNGHLNAPHGAFAYLRGEGGVKMEKVGKRWYKAMYNALILDCTSEVSHSEKLPFTIRFVGEY